MKYQLLGIAILWIANSYGQSTFHFEKSFSVNFPNGVIHQVCYISIPDVNLFGSVTVTINGGYNNQLNMGVLKKRIAIVKAVSGYFNQHVEVLDASGQLATQWHIGDYDSDNNRIPIYHLTSTGNTISIKVEGQMQHNGVANQIQNQLSITIPAVSPHTQSRQYKSIMQDRVGIGTTNPQERLSVNGDIRAKEVKVEMANWPDYVFEEDYALTPLSKLEAYIKANKHLPGIPTAKEAETNGIGLAEMNRRLLEKVEELTLYLIDLDSTNLQRDREIDALKAEVSLLKQPKTTKRRNGI